MPGAPSIQLADGRRIGGGAPCFVVGEAGSNWRAGPPDPPADRDRALALIDAAAAAGCDAVKFQTYRAETIYAPGAGESDYLAALGMRRSINEMFADLAMPYPLLAELADHARRRGVRLMSTPFSPADADAVDPHVQLHKVASYELNHLPLLVHLAATGKPIVVSTGAADWDDVDLAVTTLRGAGATQLVLLQCTARYPAPPAALELAVIPRLAARHGVPAGLSDHSADPIVAPVAAVALGAAVIEKHFTLSRRLPGPDHPFAIEPDQLAAMVRAIRASQAALGSGDKRVGDDEAELHRFARRAVQATRDIAAGELVRDGVNVAVLRPGRQPPGAQPRLLAAIDGKRARHAISAGAGVHPDDVE